MEPSEGCYSGETESYANVKLGDWKVAAEETDSYANVQLGAGRWLLKRQRAILT